MLIGIIFLAGAVLLGIGLVRSVQPLRSLLNHAEQVLWGVVIGWVVSTFGAYFVARMLGSLSFRPLLFFALALWIAAALLSLRTLRKIRGLSLRTIWRTEYRGLAVVLGFFTPIYVRLFWTHMLQPRAGGVYSAGSTFYDLPFHLALSTSFLYGQNFPPIYTPFPPAPLLYPFLPDFQIAVLAALGMSLRNALLITSIPLALAITGLFYFFAKRILDPPGNLSLSGATVSTAPFAAALATILFLLNGGLGFIYAFGDWRHSGKTLTSFLSQLDLNYANLAERNIQWTNFISDALLPQRSSLFGYAVALMVFTLFAVVWRQFFIDKNQTDRWDGWRLLFIAGVLTGLLPLFHAHVYLGLGLISGFLFLLRPRRQWLAFWIPAVLLAAPYLISVAGHASANSFMRLQPGWRGNNERIWIWYWFRNVGLPVLLIFPAWFAAPAIWRRFYLAFAGLLIFSLLVVVSPNNFDNIKLMYLWYAPTTVLVAAWLGRLWHLRHRRRQRLLILIIALVCVASGLLALQYENVNHSLLFTDEEMAAATFARERTVSRALFLTAPTFQQPILSLAGRPVLRANTDWLWSHGYEFADREADVRSIYAGSPEARSLIAYYGIDYVYIGPRERENGARQSFFETLPKIYNSANIAIYDVSGKDEKREMPATVLPREFAARVDKDPYQLLMEFPHASYAVYRLYKTAFGRRPRYDEFMRDMKIVGRDVYVGREGWEQVLENNKNALAEKCLERPDFKALYDGKSTEQYVDALLVNIGQARQREKREAVISALSTGSKSRAFGLSRIAEMINSKAEYNDAYILVHYFGYLRRNPDDPPDSNLAGFNYWLNDLNRTGDYRSVGRVFIEAEEYKKQWAVGSGQ
jgi:hypothetical protein